MWRIGHVLEAIRPSLSRSLSGRANAKPAAPIPAPVVFRKPRRLGLIVGIMIARLTMHPATCYKCGHPSHWEVFVYRKPAIFCFVCLAFLLIATAFGQGVGTIHGTVTDSSGKS